MTEVARASVVLEGDTARLDAALRGAANRMREVGSQFTAIGRELTTKVTLPIVGLGVAAVKAFGEQEDAMAKARAVIQATGGAAGITAGHLLDLGTALQRTTRFADEETQAAASVLLLFKSLRNEAGAGNDVFDRTVKVMQDVATVLGTDLSSAAIQVGKALEDPATGLTMLRRSGVTFTEAEQKQIKALFEAGKVMEAQKLILTGLETKLGGVAKALANTPLGRVKQAWNELGDAMEKVGEVIAPAIVDVADKIKTIAITFQNLDKATRQQIVGWAAFAAAIGPALLGIGLAIKAVGMLSTAFAVAYTAGARLGFLILTNPFVAFAVGLAVIGESLVKTRIEVLKTQLAMAAAKQTLTDFLRGLTPEAAQKALTALDARIVSLSGTVKELRRNQLPPAIAQLQGLARSIAIASSETLSKVASDNRQADAIQEMIDSMLGYRQVLLAVIGTQRTAKKAGDDQPLWMAEAETAGKALSTTMSGNVKMLALMGKEFDFPKAQAEAYGKTIQALVDAGVPLDAQIPGLGVSLRQLAEGYKRVSAQIAASEQEQEKWNDVVSNAKSLAESVRTPMQVYQQTMRDLAAALVAGKISQELYAEAVRGAQKALEEAKAKTEDLGEQMKQIGLTALEGWLLFAMGANGSIKDFVKSTIQEMQRLAAKLLALKILKSLGIKIPGMEAFATGGFLEPGRLGIVGEAGPEVISGGRGGVTVAPLGGMAASPMVLGGGGTFNFTIQALDARSFAELMENNPGAIVAPMIKALRHSQLLQGALR